MSEQLYPVFSDTQGRGRDKIDIEKLVAKTLTYWPSFAICVVVALLIGFAYLKYATPVYYIRGKILIKDEKNAGGASQGKVMEDLGFSNGTTNVDNEIEVLKSRKIMLQVVRDLSLNVQYYIKGSVKEIELYKAAPFTFIQLAPDALQSGQTYHVKPRNNAFTLEDGSRTINGKCGDTLNVSTGKVVLIENEQSSLQKSSITDYKVVVNTVSDAADNFEGVFDVFLSSRQTSILNLLTRDNIPDRGEEVLDKIVAVYLKSNSDDKRQVADGTISFIDTRMLLIGKELNDIEQQIQHFKQDNSLTNLSDQSKLLLDNTKDNVKQLTQLEVQLNIVESIEKYIQDPEKHIVPSTLLVQDLTLSKIIEKYNTLQAQREAMLVSNTEKNPYIQNMDQQLRTLRADIKNNLASIKSDINTSIRTIKGQMGDINSQIKDVPFKERVFLDISRQQNIKQELYLFLLKKREESAISRSGTLANVKVLEPARKENSPFAPSPNKILFTAIAIGLLLPGVRVLKKEVFNTKLASKTDITDITGIPVLGEVAHNENEGAVAVTKDSRTIVAEQFKTLRTNLQFLLTEKDQNTVLVTSSMSGEGKSFIAINLANTLALSGKNVVLLEMDLRKPKISSTLNIASKIGFSDYAIGNANMDEIIVPSGVSGNLFIIPSGNIPPNPSELLLLNATDELFIALKKKFDYIVIDTAPIGLVTDAQILDRVSNASLYVVRQNYTYKQQLRSADELFRNNKLTKMSLVINDVKAAKGSGYGYHYGNGYYIEENKKKGIRKLFSRSSF